MRDRSWSAEFFVRVMPTDEGISQGARTLGTRTRSSSELKEIVQSRLVDAMSAVAATMTMEEIHAGRGQYMRQVGEIAAQPARLQRARARERVDDQPKPERYFGIQCGQCF